MTSRKKPGVAFWATVALAGLVGLGVYAATYAWMVQPDEIVFLNGGGLHIVPDYTGEAFGNPGDRDQHFWEKVFSPAHWIDKRIRPKTWTID
jgi:hypothetical protein